MLIDSHAHLDSPEFQNDRHEVITNSGLDYILNVATDPDSLLVSVQLAEQYDFIYIGAGIHPHNAGKVDFTTTPKSLVWGFTEFQKLLDHPKIKAIGEIGLDYYRDYAPRDKQEEVFRECLREAQKRSLPVIIHQRNAQKEVPDILKDFSVTGVMHCFSGTAEYAKKCLGLGFYISFAGNITYPKAALLREVAKEVPVNRLLIETDCPWLAPQPVRGKRCEPAHVKYVAGQIAQIKGISPEEAGRITGENFKKLFKV